jgi:hypothetical protein
MKLTSMTRSITASLIVAVRMAVVVVMVAFEQPSIFKALISQGMCKQASVYNVLTSRHIIKILCIREVELYRSIVQK